MERHQLKEIEQITGLTVKAGIVDGDEIAIAFECGSFIVAEVECDDYGDCSIAIDRYPAMPSYPLVKIGVFTQADLTGVQEQYLLEEEQRERRQYERLKAKFEGE